VTLRHFGSRDTINPIERSFAPEPQLPRTDLLIFIFEDARTLIALPDNNFDWSSWRDSDHAVAEIDGILVALRAGTDPNNLSMGTLFAPTGPMQEVSLSSGWGDRFAELADRFDVAMAAE